MLQTISLDNPMLSAVWWKWQQGWHLPTSQSSTHPPCWVRSGESIKPEGMHAYLHRSPQKWIGCLSSLSEGVTRMSERQILVLPTMSAEQMCVGPPKREYNTMSASNEVPPTTVLNPTNSTRLACNACSNMHKTILNHLPTWLQLPCVRKGQP